jgi:hypothetical protein
MMSALILASLLGHAAEECPAFLVSKARGLDRNAQQVVQQYADCMRAPHLPLASALRDKSQQCAPNQVVSGKAKKATDWVDHIAKNFPGCETRLTITRK